MRSVVETIGHSGYCRNSVGFPSYNDRSQSFTGSGLPGLTDMADEITKKKVRRKKAGRAPQGTESDDDAPKRTASEQANFLEKERQGQNWEPDLEQMVSKIRKEKELPGGKGGIDDLGKQFASGTKTIKRDARLETRSGEKQMKGPRLDEKKEKEINEEKEGNIPKIPGGGDDVLEPVKFSAEDQSALELEVRKIRKDQPQK
jgi:hypothetical protein